MKAKKKQTGTTTEDRMRVRVDPTLLDRFRAASRADHESLSVWVRRLLLRETIVVEDRVRKLEIRAASDARRRAR